MSDVMSARVDRGGTLRARLMLLLALAWPCMAGAAPYAGRTVQEALRELGSGGINFIYNTEVVPPGLTVGREPGARTPVAIAREILAEHGLVLVVVGTDAYAIARGESGASPPAAAAGSDAAASLPQLVVTTSRYELADGKADQHSFLTRAEVEALPKLADEPLRAVRHLPGAASSGVSALSHIRGGELNETLMVLDGLPLSEPFHLKNFLAPVSVFDGAAIESMEVSSGGFTANYGDRMSGVIDIRPLIAPEERYTELGLSLFHTSGLSAGMFDDARGQWLAAARRSNLDVLTNLSHEDIGKPEYFDAFGRVAYALSDATHFFATALTSRDEISLNSRDKTKDVDAEYRNTYVWGGWEQAWSSVLSSRLTLALTDVDNDREGTIVEPGRRDSAVDERRTLRMGVARLDLEHRLPRLYTRFGVEGRELKAKYRYVSRITNDPDFPLPGDPGGTQTRDLAPEPDGHQSAAYITSRVRMTDSFSGEFGLRWDHQSYLEDSGPEQFAPRVNLLYEPVAGTRLRAAWGRFWQAQAINELQVEDGVDTFYPAQRADHLILGLEQDLPAGMGLRIEAYQKDYDRVRPHYENLFDPVTYLPELEPDRVMVDPDSGRARGVEVSLSQRTDGPWSWWLSYAWSRVTDRISGADVVRSWDQRHAINAGLRYTGRHWEFTVTDNYHTGWPTTDLLLIDGTDGAPDLVTPGVRNATRFGAYNSLDFRVMRRFELPDSTLEAFFEMTNTLGQRNACCTEYTVSGAGDAVYIDADEDYWPRFIPSFGVVWKF